MQVTIAKITIVIVIKIKDIIDDILFTFVLKFKSYIFITLDINNGTN